VAGVHVEGNALLAAKVSGRAGRDGRAAAAARAKCRLDGALQLVCRDTRAKDGNVALGKDLLGVRLDVVGRDGRMRRGVERVAKAAAEGEGVCRVERERERVGERREGLGLNGGEDELGELVRQVLGRGEDGREELEEVLPGSEK
jgi:hypothetical protein